MTKLIDWDKLKKDYPESKFRLVSGSSRLNVPFTYFERGEDDSLTVEILVLSGTYPMLVCDDNGDPIKAYMHLTSGEYIGMITGDELVNCEDLVSNYITDSVNLNLHGFDEVNLSCDSENKTANISIGESGGRH